MAAAHKHLAAMATHPALTRGFIAPHKQYDFLCAITLQKCMTPIHQIFLVKNKRHAVKRGQREVDFSSELKGLPSLNKLVL